MPQFHPNQLPYARQDKIAVVTGANSGLGYYITMHLYLHGWIVYMGCRSADRAACAIKDIHKEWEGRKKQLPASANPGVLHHLHLDYGDLKSVSGSVSTLLTKVDAIDLLINNAGVMGSLAEVTKDGYDIQTQTNHLGPWLFTQLLVPRMKSHARVVWVSSIGHFMGDRHIHLSRKYHRRPNLFFTWFRYGNSKTANIHTSMILSEKYPSLTNVSCHPGFSLFTNLLTYWTDLPVAGPAFSLFFQGFMLAFGVSQEEAAYAPLRAALSREIGPSTSGTYLTTYGEIGTPSRRASDRELALHTWDWTAKELNARGVYL